MRRRFIRPYGATVGPTRLLSLLMAVGLLAVLHQRFSDPGTWRWLTGEKAADDPTAQVNADPATDAAPAPQAAPPQEDHGDPAKAVDGGTPTPGVGNPGERALLEKVVAGPNDLDPEAADEMAEMLSLVRDRTPLILREMPAYWKLLEWSRTQSFADLWKRAQGNFATAQIWNQPDNYRGKLLRMRLHVRRAIPFDGGDNPLNVKEVVECWGWTEESRSVPYVIVLWDPPANLPRGPKVEAELNFVGYFLKNMAYDATEKRMASPLFLGRGQVVVLPPPPGVGPKMDRQTFVVFAGIGAAVVIVFVYLNGRRVRKTRVDLSVLPESLPSDLAQPPLQRTDRPDGPSSGIALSDPAPFELRS